MNPLKPKFQLVFDPKSDISIHLNTTDKIGPLNYIT